MRKKNTPEGKAKSIILRYLERRGFFAWNNPSGAVCIAPDRWLHFGKKGSADIIGCLPGGRFLAVEVKAQDGRLAPEQSAFLETIRGLGGVAVIVRSFRAMSRTLRHVGGPKGLKESVYAKTIDEYNRQGGVDLDTVRGIFLVRGAYDPKTGLAIGIFLWRFRFVPGILGTGGYLWPHKKGKCPARGSL